MRNITNEKIAINIQQGNKEYITPLWNRIYKLIIRKCNRYYNFNKYKCICAGITEDDLIQEAFLAYLAAVNAYKPNIGYKFTAYLNYPLKNHFNALIGYRTFKSQNNPLNNSISLETPLEDDLTIADTLEDADAQNAYNVIIEKDYILSLHNDLEKSLNNLTPFQRDLIKNRYYDNTAYTQLAKAFNTTPHSIRNVIKKALLIMSRDINLKEYRDNIISQYAWKQRGVKNFHNTNTSSTEYTVIKLLELDDKYKKIIRSK